ncbi:RpiB/LacA/LacB family sugar-phosphate isomerase [Candidatus Gracilibacteria bacterium]|nr:RpiB/LacA/LacB family sugar-phosphate isomerase [Candidatus Gracilibacteria bacterium]
MKIFLASDHGGFELKKRILEYLETKCEKEIPKQVRDDKRNKEYELEDVGCVDTQSCDYPIFGRKLAEKVVANPGTRGIVVCGSGVGISIAANKVHGARCVLANSIELAHLGRLHNGANILAMGERTKFVDAPIKIVDEFLSTEEDMSERHVRRREQLDEMGIFLLAKRKEAGVECLKLMFF